MLVIPKVLCVIKGVFYVGVVCVSDIFFLKILMIYCIFTVSFLIFMDRNSCQFHRDCNKHVFDLCVYFILCSLQMAPSPND